jgi:hypothetical protein
MQVWNMVRETNDHGPLNSWDRQAYWTLSGVDDGFNDPQVGNQGAALCVLVCVTVYVCGCVCMCVHVCACVCMGGEVFRGWRTIASTL